MFTVSPFELALLLYSQIQLKMSPFSKSINLVITDPYLAFCIILEILSIHLRNAFLLEFLPPFIFDTSLI